VSSYRTPGAAARILASTTGRSSTASCFQDREVEDDPVGPTGQTYRSGKWPRPACWAGQVGCGPLAASSLFFYFNSFLFSAVLF
jgi:hypothetical protein